MSVKTLNSNMCCVISVTIMRITYMYIQSHESYMMEDNKTNEINHHITLQDSNVEMAKKI